MFRIWYVFQLLLFVDVAKKMTSKTTDFARYDRAAQSSAPLISRKDTIIIAMLVNIALLVVLFATASRRHEAQEVEIKQMHLVAQDTKNVVREVPKTTKRQAPVDEIDEVLARLAKGKTTVATNTTQAKATASSEPEYYIVKSGDSPWKIARKYHIDFDDLLKLNGLDEEKAKNLKIGQKIRIR